MIQVALHDKVTHVDVTRASASPGVEDIMLPCFLRGAELECVSWSKKTRNELQVEEI